MPIQDLDYIFKLLSSSYENMNIISKNSTCIFNEKLLDYLYLKKLFKYRWLKQSALKTCKDKFSYTYDIIKTTKDYIKIKFNIIHYFYIKNNPRYIKSGANNEFIIIFEKSFSKLKFLFLVSKEENTKLYNWMLKNDLSPKIDLTFSNEISYWLNKISSIDLIYNEFLSLISKGKNQNITQRKANFNIDLACSYAETYALDPNPEYIDFSKNGGDCTNFTSQIIHSGGIKYTPAWKPYSNSWIRVQELYSYLISSGIGHNVNKDTPLARGMVIQFYKPSKGRFFHSGFITYELQNKDFLYCCHTYNKLNYPLSAIYPVIYPTLRAVKL